MCLVIIAALSISLRMTRLDHRPMHHDEANQALRCEPLLSHNTYIYDPTDHHGPTLYYAATSFLRLSGNTDFNAYTESSFRFVTVCAGLLIIAMLWFMRAAWGTVGILIAMCVTALSPGLVYYSRFFIHEIFLVAATMGLLVSIWRYAQKPSLWWAISIGGSMGLMVATKETAMLTLFALLISSIFVMRQVILSFLSSHAFPWKHTFIALCACSIVITLFFSSFGHNWEGLISLAHAMPQYAHRAAGGEHEHSAWLYGGPLMRYEWPLVPCALIGIGAALRSRVEDNASLFRRIIALTTLILISIYCVIPYKTPWCFMTPLALLALLAGHGATVALSIPSRPIRIVAGIIMAGLILILGCTSYAMNISTEHTADNRWSYVETSDDLLRLTKRLENIAAIHPRGYDMTVLVVTPQDHTWPLPWYLRRFRHVGYFTSMEHVPHDIQPDIVIEDPETSADLQTTITLPNNPSNRLFSLRSQVFLRVICATEWWQRTAPESAPIP